MPFGRPSLRSPSVGECQRGSRGRVSLIERGRLFSLLPLILMSAPAHHLTELPIEILEKILLYLPGQDIIKMEAVRAVSSNSVRCLTLCLWPRSVDTSGIFYAICPPFNVNANSFLLA